MREHFLHARRSSRRGKNERTFRSRSENCRKSVMNFNFFFSLCCSWTNRVRDTMNKHSQHEFSWVVSKKRAQYIIVERNVKESRFASGSFGETVFVLFLRHLRKKDFNDLITMEMLLATTAEIFGVIENHSSRKTQRNSTNGKHSRIKMARARGFTLHWSCGT